ncbi:hypothetical protein M8J75_009693 [Diaphorina citri]|nr:hypothetical protein M8J77_015018 [Diaphorina citri]KAI5710559.1 hypothetical protein M8J75_009693 [Diaphorina citri]
MACEDQSTVNPLKGTTSPNTIYNPSPNTIYNPLANEWRNVASNREEWRKRINSGVLAKQEMDIAKAKVKRHERHLAEEEFIWECPVCNFKKEGRTGRQYVNSHIVQAHRDLTTERQSQQQNLQQNLPDQIRIHQSCP